MKGKESHRFPVFVTVFVSPFVSFVDTKYFLYFKLIRNKEVLPGLFYVLNYRCIILPSPHIHTGIGTVRAPSSGKP